MYLRFIILAITISTISLSVPTSAKDKINYKAIDKKGFEQVTDVLKQMSPQQLEEVMRQAKELQPELEAMSQEEIDQLTNELLQMETTLDAKAIDIKKLDPKKSKSLKEIRTDIKKELKKQQ